MYYFAVTLHDTELGYRVSSWSCSWSSHMQINGLFVLNPRDRHTSLVVLFNFLFSFILFETRSSMFSSLASNSPFSCLGVTKCQDYRSGVSSLLTVSDGVHMVYDYLSVHIYPWAVFSFWKLKDSHFPTFQVNSYLVPPLRRDKQWTVNK